MDTEARRHNLSTFCQIFTCPDDLEGPMAEEFAGHLEMISLPQDSVLFRQGDSGALAVLLTGDDGLERRIDVLEPGAS